MKNFATTFSKVFGFITAIFLLSNTTAFAQITITSSQFISAFTQIAASTNYEDFTPTGLQPLINQSGANQTWDFSALTFTLNTFGSAPSSVVAYSSSLPEATSFPSATLVEISYFSDDTDYDFYESNQNGFYLIGSSEVSNGISSITGTNDPPLEEIAFPLTYQTPPWSSNSTVISSGDTSKEETISSVDSWGSFILPGKTTAQSLRVKQMTITSTPTKIIGIDTMPASTDTNYDFIWISNSGYSASIRAGASENATYASYSVPSAPNIVSNNAPSPNYSLSIGSNPVISPTNVSFTMPGESEVRISVMDPLGRESQLLMNGMAHSGLNTLPLDPANLVNGTYFLRIQSDGYSAVQKMSVAH